MKTGQKVVSLEINGIEIEAVAHFDFAPEQKQTHDDPSYPAEIYITGLISNDTAKVDFMDLMLNEAIENSILEQI